MAVKYHPRVKLTTETGVDSQWTFIYPKANVLDVLARGAEGGGPCMRLCS